VLDELEPLVLVVVGKALHVLKKHDLRKRRLDEGKVRTERGRTRVREACCIAAHPVARLGKRLARGTSSQKSQLTWLHAGLGHDIFWRQLVHIARNGQLPLRSVARESLSAVSIDLDT